jgi:CheY-like chemotaxis protein
MNPAQIVLIEDNPADVYLVELAMQENDIRHQLTRFASGEEALEFLCGPGAADSVVPDAILLDLNTPRSDGFEVLIKLKQEPRLAKVPIAIITSSRATSDKHRSRLQGTRLIEKPSQLEDFSLPLDRRSKRCSRTPRNGRKPHWSRERYGYGFLNGCVLANQQLSYQEVEGDHLTVHGGRMNEEQIRVVDQTA